ncbi:13626_t:CDS:2, partial [Cetraspora pellucida]
SIYKLGELSDDALIVLMSETSCIMYDTNNEKPVGIPYFNEQTLYTSEVLVSFFKDGDFVLINDSKVYLYSVNINDKNILQCKNIFAFTIELDQCILSRYGKLLVGNDYLRTQWNIKTGNFEIQYPVANDLLFNKYYTLLAVWHNVLKIYSAKTGIEIFSFDNEIDYKDPHDENFQISFINLGERLLIAHFMEPKMETCIIDPYSLKDSKIVIDLYDDINSVQIGFVPKKIFENKIIGIVNRKVHIYDLFQGDLFQDDLFQGDFKEYLRKYVKDHKEIHLLSIMEEILFNIKKVKNDISG